MTGIQIQASNSFLSSFQVPSDPPAPKKPKIDDSLQSPIIGDKEKQSSWLRSLSNSSSKVSFRGLVIGRYACFVCCCV